MRDRKLAVYSLTAMMMIMTLACSGTGQPQPETQAQIANRDVDFGAGIARIYTTLCQRSCEQNYNACVIFQSQQDINSRLAKLPGMGPVRAPGKEIPGCWPFACEEENSDPAKPKPAPSCSAGREACLAKC